MPEEKAGIPDFEKPLLKLEAEIEELERLGSEEEIDFGAEIKKLKQKHENLQKDIFSTLTPWQKVQLARHPGRPYTLDYINLIFQNFVELHGDRRFGDDPAIVAGFAQLNGEQVMLIGHQKGRDIQEKMLRNFGMPHPEGYRKALRLMKLAERFHLPVVTLVDTPGAYPGIGAEERGQAEAIAVNLQDMSMLEVPIVSIVIGEGGSGGALALAVADVVMMLENSIYSVISPEGCASILFRDPTLASRASEELKLTAQDLKRLGIIDEIIQEPLGGCHRNKEEVAGRIKEKILNSIRELKKISPEKLIEGRYDKFRKMGRFRIKKGGRR